MQNENYVLCSVSSAVNKPGPTVTEVTSGRMSRFGASCKQGGTVEFYHFTPEIKSGVEFFLYTRPEYLERSNHYV